jgi:hypothetical protein
MCRAAAELLFVAHRIMSSGELTHSLPFATQVSGTLCRSVRTPLAYRAAVWYMPAILQQIVHIQSNRRCQAEHLHK